MDKTAAARLLLTAAALALCLGAPPGLHAEDATVPLVPEERPAVEKAVDKIGESIGDTIDEVIGEKAGESIDESHEDQAQFIGLFFEKIDRVFGEQYVEDRDRKIQVRAGLETTINNDGASTDTKVKVVLRVPLPAMKRRLNAFVDIGDAVEQLGDVSSPNFSDSENAFTVAAGLVRRIRDDMEAGLKLKFFRSSGSLLEVYPFLRYENQVDAMRYFLEQQVIWESDNTWRTLTDLDVDRRFGSLIFLRLRNRIEYSFEEPGFSIAHALVTRRSLFENNGLSFEVWLEYNTAKDDPERIEDDTILYGQLRLRGRVWRTWLEYELRPIYSFPIATDRKSFFGFFISLAVVWDSHLGGDGRPAVPKLAR